MGSQLPSEMAELIKRIIKLGDSFITEFDRKKSRMREIAREFDTIADEVKEMIETANAVKTGGLIGGGVSLGIGLLGALAVPFTGGASLAAAAAVGGAIGAAAGGTVAIGAVVVKNIKENGRAKDLEQLGKEFMKLAEPLNEYLSEIKTLTKQLEGNVLKARFADMVEIKRLTARVSDISEHVFEQIKLMMGFLGELVSLVVKIFISVLSDEEDKKLTDVIMKSGEECRKAIREFEDMKNEIKTFKDKVNVV